MVSTFSHLPISLADWLRYLEQLHPKTIALGLERIEKVRQKLALSPQFPIITVGGTNGKGSTCAMLESILASAGYHVGCYTSPHLLRYNERVRIASQSVNDKDLCHAFTQIEAARGDVALTYFEFGTLAAMLLFIRAKVDVAILEVGLGGRLDAVNVFDPTCAIITSIDIDHIDYLGASREAISFEKAGIFRSDIPAICAEPDPPLPLLQHAAAINARLSLINKDFGFIAELRQWTYWDAKGRRIPFGYPALRGQYQLSNASAAICALEQLHQTLPVSVGDIRKGLLQLNLPGRFQVLPGRPSVILDVAHNPHAAQALAANLKVMSGYTKTIAVFAMLKDKDIAAVIEAVQSQIDYWFVGSIHEPRGADVEFLKRIMSGKIAKEKVEYLENVAEAYAYACKAAGENDRIIVFGSFYTVAEVLKQTRPY